MKYLFLLSLPIIYSNAVAQSNSDVFASKNIQTNIDESPFVSTRASGMGGAISPIANGSDATHFNPAGIGGLHRSQGKKSPISVKFPYVGVSANKNTQKLRNEFAKENGADDAIIGDSIVSANEGKNQFGRTSAGLELSFGRSLLRTYSDAQLAAVKTSGDNASEGDISLKYRGLTGAGFGFSVLDSKETFYLGGFTSYNHRTDIEVENVTYSEIVTKDDRNQIIENNSYSWSGLSTNVGMLWVFEKKVKPALSVVIRDFGESKYTNVSAPKNERSEPKIAKQDLTVGFSVSPMLSSQNYFNFVIEGFNLLESQTNLKKKLRTGLEFTLDGFGADGLLGIRCGYSSAGLSYGTSLNLGLLQIGFASEAVDIGVNNKTFLDRRNVATLTINVSDD